LRAAVLEVLTERLRARNVDPASLSDATSLVEVGVTDSMGFLTLASEIEQRIGKELDFSEADPEDFTSVGGLMRALRA
jgi:acyl carrier protein